MLCPQSLTQSFTFVWFFVTPWTVAHQALLFMGFSRQKILEWVAISFSKGEGIFQTQRLNPGLLHCRQILYCLSHQGSLISFYSQKCFLPMDHLPPSVNPVQWIWENMGWISKEHGKKRLNQRERQGAFLMIGNINKPFFQPLKG